jgi:hypothetical protein
VAPDVPIAWNCYGPYPRLSPVIDTNVLEIISTSQPTYVHFDSKGTNVLVLDDSAKRVDFDGDWMIVAVCSCSAVPKRLLHTLTSVLLMVQLGNIVLSTAHSNVPFSIGCWGVDFLEINGTRYAANLWHYQRHEVPEAKELLLQVAVEVSRPSHRRELGSFSWHCAIRTPSDTLSTTVGDNSAIVLPSCVNDKIVSPYLSLPLLVNQPQGQVIQIALQSDTLGVKLLVGDWDNELRVDGQLSTALHLELFSKNNAAANAPLACVPEITLQLSWHTLGSSADSKVTIPLVLALPQMHNGMVALTYVDFDRTVRQAIAVPPRKRACGDEGCGVLLLLASQSRELEPIIGNVDARETEWLLIPQVRLLADRSMLATSGIVDELSAQQALKALAQYTTRKLRTKADISRVMVVPYQDRDGARVLQYAARYPTTTRYVCKHSTHSTHCTSID